MMSEKQTERQKNQIDGKGLVGTISEFKEKFPDAELIIVEGDEE